MRTTLVLQDDLLLEARKRAAERQSNVSAIVNEALRKTFSSSSKQPEAIRFEMPVFQPLNAMKVKTSPHDIHELLVAEDLSPYRS